MNGFDHGIGHPFPSQKRWLKAKVEAGLHLNTGASDGEEALGQAMVELNIAGVNDRYGQGEAKPCRDFTCRYTPAYGSKIQVFKSMPCWLYPCTAGAVVTRPLYRFFKTVSEPHLMRRMILELPAYDRAQRG